MKDGGSPAEVSSSPPLAPRVSRGGYPRVPRVSPRRPPSVTWVVPWAPRVAPGVSTRVSPGLQLGGTLDQGVGNPGLPPPGSPGSFHLCSTFFDSGLVSVR